MIRIEKNKFLFMLLGILELLVLGVLCVSQLTLSYMSMALIGILQWGINVFLLKLYGKLEIISIPNIFSFFSLVFHCGQIIKSGFDIPGMSPLPFENYASFNEIYASFMFYCFSQVIYCVAVCLKLDSGRGFLTNTSRWNLLNKEMVCYLGKLLLLVGIIPRLYIDVTSIQNAAIGGYEGVYTKYYPQAIQSLAFFFDAGLIFLIYTLRSVKSKRALFMTITVYKCLMMTTGARQEKVAFLLIWIYAYLFVVNKINLKGVVFLIVAGIGGAVLISAIGAVRVSESISVFDVVDYFKHGEINNIVGNFLGEFGGALNTLEVAIRYTPSNIMYGYGRTYIAGILSVVPLLVAKIPELAKTAYFLDQLPGSIIFAFGGSYLGEIFYNFAWMGVFVSGIIGAVLGKVHNKIQKSYSSNLFDRCWYTVLSIALILYIRGYFVDMVQKLVWAYLMMVVAREIIIRNNSKRVKAENEK